MKTCYFFSGFDAQSGFTNEIAYHLQTHLQERKSLVYIASSPHAHEKTDRYARVNMDWFHKIGIRFEQVEILDDRKTMSECQELIQQATAVLLAGGTTLPQMAFIRERGLIPLLRQQDCTVMGISAGAINMAKRSFYSADEECKKTHIYEGIGLADVTIEPHFSPDNDDLIQKDLLPFSEFIDIYAVCDGGAIFVENDNKTYLGDVYLISAGHISQVSRCETSVPG